MTRVTLTVDRPPAEQGTQFPHVMSPLRINGVELKNRIVRTAHGTGYAENGITERLIAFHEARARGGVALLTIETASVHPSTGTGAGVVVQGSGRASELIAFTDEVKDGWSRLADRVHVHGAKVFQQLWHGGALATPIGGGASWGPSDVPEPYAGRIPQPMTKAMIDDIVAAFASAARRAKEAGLDGAEVHGAHGYLVGQFLSPLTNHRDDEYGGSIQNRARFATEVLAAMRSEVGPDFPVGIRISGTEAIPGGIEPPEAAETARLLDHAGAIDFLNVSMGGHYNGKYMIGGMDEPHGYELPTSAVVTAAVSVPTIVTGRILSLAEAEEVLENGIADLVSMVRATIADPDLVAKQLRGDGAQVRPCIGINQGCGERGRLGLMACTVNVNVGHEEDDPLTAAAVSKRILVVGAGPAGMEAARVAALRGHEVVVHDARPRAGGLVRFAERAPFRAEIGGIVDWQESELKRLGVELVLDSTVDLELVRRLAPDEVIVATGAVPRRDGFQRGRPGTTVVGTDLPHVVTPLDVLGDEGLARTPKRVVVFENVGTYPPLGAAEYLLEQGAEVVLATGQLTYGLTAWGGRPSAAQRFQANPRFSSLTRVLLEEITPDHVVMRDLDGDREFEVPADLVVLMTSLEPRSTLDHELATAGIDHRVVGDASAPANLDQAIASGYRAGASL